MKLGEAMEFAPQRTNSKCHIDNMLSILYLSSMEGPTLPTDPWTLFVMSVFRLNGQIVEAGESISGSVGQTSSRWQVLGSTHVPQTAAEIARRLGISRQGVQRVANVLMEEGLIASSPHPTDQRTFLLELTPRGRAVMAEIYSQQLKWSSAVEKVLDVDRMRKATQLLSELGDALEPEVQRLRKNKDE